MSAEPRKKPRKQTDWTAIGVVALLLVASFLVAGHRVRLSEWHVDRTTNAALDEAIAWKGGQLALDQHHYESAMHDGRVYNVVGLAFTLISVVVTSLTGLAGQAGDVFPPAVFVLLVAIPIPFAAFWALRTQVPKTWAAVLAFSLVAATPLLPVLSTCRGGSIYYINHCLAVTGLLVMLADLLGHRRWWPAMIGLALAAWSRQMTVLYAIPLLLMARSESRPSVRRRSVGTVVVGTVLITIVPATLNTLKFGSPLQTGYKLMYEGRTDAIGQRAQTALFSLEYCAMHAEAMHYAYPAWDIRGGTLFADTSETRGGSIWMTTPLFIATLVAARAWWADKRRRALMLTTLPILFGLMCYHTTGSDGSGFYRYGLDVLPIWLVSIAPAVVRRPAIPWTLAAIAYSALYFNLIPY